MNHAIRIDKMEVVDKPPINTQSLGPNARSSGDKILRHQLRHKALQRTNKSRLAPRPAIFAHGHLPMLCRHDPEAGKGSVLEYIPDAK